MSRSLVRWSAGGAALALLALIGLAAVLPAPDLAPARDVSTVVLARGGETLRAYPALDGSWRLPVEPGAVDERYWRFLIAIEDRRFAAHPGVDPLALLRAAAQAVRHGEIVSGGSTLAMQVAKLLDPRPRTVAAKAVELVQAVRLTWGIGRAGVLRHYAHLAPFGGNLVGVRAASLAWFGHEPDRLTDAEAALLVALPRSPEQLRPDRDAAAARRARDRVIDRLERQGLLDAGAAAAARAAPLGTLRRPMPIAAAHLADRARAALPAERWLATTLDAALQDGVERVLERSAAELPAPVELAAVVLAAASGEILAYAGSASFLGEGRSGMIDHGKALRSPGSTLKPLVVAMAFDRGLAHPASLIRDAPTRFADYAPENFGRDFSGDVTVREALQASLNLPAVTLLERVGPVAFTRGLAAAGVELRTGPGLGLPGLPIVLGGVGTTLLDLAGAYTALAVDGRIRIPRWEPDAPSAEPLPLVGPEAAAAVRAILAQAPRPAAWSGDGRPLAFKTGTSHRFRDGWAVGFDGAHVIAVWIGRADGGSCRICNGIGGAAPVLHRIAALVPAVPLRRGPPAGSGLAAATPPPALVRIETAAVAAALDPDRPVLRFPPDSARLERSGPQAVVPLRVQGGVRPYRWLVDGRPVAGPTARTTALWRPDGPGWSEITVIDAAGRSASSTVRVD